jgi:hypothetical protein
MGHRKMPHTRAESYAEWRHRSSSGGAHLYKHGAKDRERREFEHRYGKSRGDYVYGAVVGKVYREQHGHPYKRRRGSIE